MRTGRPKAKLVVSNVERETLERWARRPKTAQALAQRARIVLGCATEATNRAVATRFGVTEQMVGKWRARFVGRRLDGLLDEPRPGAPQRAGERLSSAGIALLSFERSIYSGLPTLRAALRAGAGTPRDRSSLVR